MFQPSLKKNFNIMKKMGVLKKMKIPKNLVKFLVTQSYPTPRI
jgi:hypothetical protein